ncbi:MAG: S8 family serine peptidase [Bacteroidota bacterium]
MHKIIFFVATIIFCFQLTPSFAQYNDSLGYYWVELEGGKDSTLLSYPLVFLSQSAIDRRLRQGITIEESDLPVSQEYVNQLVDLGADIHSKSKWLNAVTIAIGKEQINKVEELNFVKSVKYVGRFIAERKYSTPSFNMTELNEDLILPDYFHGLGTPQIRIMNADTLHDLGYKGQGIQVAVMDGGFINVDKMPFLSHLEYKHTYDFVDRVEGVFKASTHGSQVLAVMASNAPNLFVGTAPLADYICLKTEDVKGEYILEECNMIAALEYADSLGVEVVNISLGYSEFTDKSMDYTYEDLNGDLSLSSKSCEYAYNKGMIVVGSAGNEGNGKWKYITVPGDSKYMLTVGATDLAGQYAGFSSIGPTTDGRIKPDLSAPGAQIITPGVQGWRLIYGSGTSYASPILAGAVACLWQAFPRKTNKEIIDALIQSCNKTDDPDNFVGHGMPDFGKAFRLLEK